MNVTERSAEWIYRGIWRFLVACFKVPDGPPNLLVQREQGDLRVFHPSRRYLSYLKMYFWVALVAIDAAILIGWLALYWAQPYVALALAVPALLIAVVPDIIAYIALHLRYDTIWYGVSDRGIYIRRGILVITEHTITLENVQNVLVHRGPIEQLFGITTITVETAGAQAGEEQNSIAVGNKAIMVGLEDADTIRELLMTRVRATRSAGLGDGLDDAGAHRWSPADVGLLKEILDEVRNP